jgi:hypothetical protein
MSIILNPSEQLLIASDVLATTTELQARVSYADTVTGTVGANSVSTHGNTPEVLTQATGSSARVISGINFVNLDTVAHQVKIGTGASGAFAAGVFNATLNPGDSLQFTTPHSWCIFNAYGYVVGVAGPYGPPGANGVVEIAPVNAQTGTAYTLQATDAPGVAGYFGIVTMSNAAANAVTIPPGIFPVGTRVDIIQLGTGATSLTPGSGVTLEGSTSISAQYGSVTLVQTVLNTWVSPPSAAAGTVTSVALSMPADFVVGGSPITSSGTLAVTRATQTANTVQAGPASGSAATPSYRALVLADIPSVGAASGLATLDASSQVAATNLRRKINALGNITGAVNIDLSSGGVITATMTGNCTFTLVNAPPSGYVADMELRLTQDATGSRIATWPANGKWPGASPFVLSTAANTMDVVGISADNGLNWIGYPVEDVG